MPGCANLITPLTFGKLTITDLCDKSFSYFTYSGMIIVEDSKLVIMCDKIISLNKPKEIIQSQIQNQIQVINNKSAPELSCIYIEENKMHNALAQKEIENELLFLTKALSSIINTH